MNRDPLLFCCFWLVFRTSYAAEAAAPSTPPPPSPSWSLSPPPSPESTPGPESLLAPGPATTSPRDPPLPQQNQTVSPKQPRRAAGLSQEEEEEEEEEAGRAPFRSPAHTERRAPSSARSQQWPAAAGGVEIVLMEPKGQLPKGEPRQGAANHAMGLFLGGCGLLLCLFVGIYCTYSRGAKKEPFAHHRLYEDGFDDPALFLDNPKDYDWFFYETDGYVYPTPSLAHPKPIQTLSIPGLKQPASALEMAPPGKLETPEAPPGTKPPSPRLECLSPANLHMGNFL